MSATTALNFRDADEDLVALADEFEGGPPQAVLRWAIEEFGSDVALATGFGTEGCILVEMVASIDPAARIFYLDTDLLFPETYQLRDRLAARYGVRFERRATSRSLEKKPLSNAENYSEDTPAT